MRELDQFILFLDSKGLSETTIQEYLYRYNIFPTDQELSDEIVRQFISKHNNSVGRAFVKSYLEFKKRKDIEVPKLTGRKRQRVSKTLSESELEALRQAIYSRQVKYGLMFDLQYYCALRRQELVDIIPEWFKLEKWFKNPEKGGILHIIGKGDKERLVVVPSWLMENIVDYLEKNNFDMEDRIFKMTAYNWYKKLRDISEQSIGRKIKTHDLRHTRTTNWLKNKIPIEQVQKRVGHSSISTTQRYAHFKDEEIIDEWQEES